MLGISLILEYSILSNVISRLPQ